MTTYFQNISSILPFDKKDLIDVTDILFISEPSCQNFVHKQSLSPTVLNTDFHKFLSEKGLEVEKVLIWHWYNEDPYWAHIDSNDQGVVSPCALNWTLSTDSSQVNFYDIENVEKTVKFGNDIDENSITENVTSYIPINVKGLNPSAVWDDQGPAVINTSVPHMVVSSGMRISVSLNFKNPMPTIEDVIDRLYK